jgi:hypothetical protein
MARRMKAFLNPEGESARGTPADAARHENLAEAPTKNAGQRPPSGRRERIESKRRELRSKKQELRKIRGEANAARHGPEGIEHKKRKKKAQQEVFQLEKELRAAREGRTESEPVTGSLPDWEPEASQIVPRMRDQGSYEREMDPATRERLHEFFEPHNRRLYEFLGVDFGW